jgi:hypothetical protein
MTLTAMQAGMSKASLTLDKLTVFCLFPSLKMHMAFFWIKSNLLPWKPGVDVMITIFGDFRQFSTKKMAFSQKTKLWSKFYLI